MDALEIEVKFHISSVSALRDAVINSGALHHGKVFEENIRFENQDQTLQGQGILLRLRRDGGNVLTLKTKTENPDPSFKIHHEFEVLVSDLDTMQTILEKLGFYPAQVYEKWRETFCLGSAEILIDRLPYGDFLEIEGDRDQILRITQMLGLDWNRRITMNYLDMFDIIRKNERLKFHDVSFENFKDIRFDAAKYVSLFETR
jgi:adenylate cyclase class 2